MNTFFLQLLADRKGIPAGLVLATRHPPEPAAPLLQLAARFPCHYRAGLPSACATPLHNAGWRLLPADRTMHADAPPGASLPPHVTWIEGTWALAPPARATGKQSTSRALALELVQRVNVDADTHEIEELLRRDPTLSYHLLRLVNSLGMGAGRKVTNFAQAILLLGRQQLRRWLNLMLFAASNGDERSAMLLARVSVRARLMELLARATGMDRLKQELAFMTGMFSLLGVLFGAPLAEVLAPLAIADVVQRALLDRHGELGKLLALVEAAESADFDTVAAALEEAQLAPGDFNAMVVEANLWMLGVTGNVAGSTHG
ncbi:HDOD domain-containing protein [Massilia sp. METH4]|uniref:EAL and HDOD domain-containing protein n=1 Tax=Massilia sp. METH4 TaxID=3123041 RepID=UPI0030D12621